jgi:glycosyltransferase involved in cell wall biosynthesis
LAPAEAKRRLGIGAQERTVLFFGSIRPYKGLEYLLAGFEQLVTGSAEAEKWRLIIAGEPMEPAQYVRQIRAMIPGRLPADRIIDRMEFVPDNETEIYFKAADVLVLPYNEIFQSGVLFLSYAFGLPVLAADVGSFKEDIVDGKTGMIFRPRDAGDLAKTMARYFASGLYRDLAARREDIKEHARTWHSWETAGEITRNVYLGLLDTRGG